MPRTASLSEVPPRGSEWITVASAWVVAFSVTSGFGLMATAALTLALLSLRTLLVDGPLWAVFVLGGSLLGAHLFYKGARGTLRYLGGLTQRVLARRRSS